MHEVDSLAPQQRHATRDRLGKSHETTRPEPACVRTVLATPLLVPREHVESIRTEPVDERIVLVEQCNRKVAIAVKVADQVEHRTVRSPERSIVIGLDQKNSSWRSAVRRMELHAGASRVASVLTRAAANFFISALSLSSSNVAQTATAYATKRTRPTASSIAKLAGRK